MQRSFVARVSGRMAWAAVCAVAATGFDLHAQGLREAVRRAEAAGLRAAVCVRDVDADGTLFAHRADAPQRPASNQKLLTALAFLQGVGPDYRFRTGFRVEGGRLVVRAGGDPNWSIDGPIDPSTAFAGVAAALRRGGVEAVRSVWVEAGAFTGPNRPKGWPVRDLARDFAAPTGGVVLDRGRWVAEIGPGDHDAIVRVVSPPGGLPLSGRIRMTADKQRGGVFHLEIRDGALAMRGHFWVGNQARVVSGAVDDPEPLFVAALESALRRSGVAIDPAAPALDLELPAVESPLAPAFDRMLQDSSNFDAEQLLRVLGAVVAGDGSFAGALGAMRTQLEERLGPLPDGVVLADGSGLSHDNRATARLLCDVLVEAAHGPHAEVFVGALPRGGQEGTTLRKRFAGTDLASRVRAKTGTLSGVSALSGYLQTREGRLLAFAILMEVERRVRGASAHREQERIVAALDQGT